MFSWLALYWITGCSNPCVDYCKRLDSWLDTCGITWEAEYPENDWTSVDDCYDHYWEASDNAQSTCSKEASRLDDKECY